MQSNMDLVSIVVPVYNVEKFIRECLQSVVEQTYPQWELIVINDCTPDLSMSVVDLFVQQYPSQIKVINNPSNVGQGISRNRGVGEANGVWIFFLDSDDKLEPNCLERLIQSADESPDLDIILANSYHLRSDSKICKSNHLVEDFNFSKYALAMYAWGTLFRRSFWLQHEFKFENCYAEDLLLISQVWSATSKIKVISDPLYDYRFNPSSATHTFQSFERISYTVEQLLKHYLINQPKTDEVEAFLLSNIYNLIKMLASPFDRYRIFKLLLNYLPSFPQGNSKAVPPLLSHRKLRKLHKIYASKGLYFFWHIDGRSIKYFVLKLMN